MELKQLVQPSESSTISSPWRACDISDLCRLQRGFDITEATRKPGSVPVYSSSGLAYWHNESRVKPPGVITGRKGLLGKVFFVDEPYWPHDTTLWVKDFLGNDPQFVYWFLKFFRLERYDAATSVPTLNRNNLVGIPIVLPPLPEQRRISECLAEAELLVSSLAGLIAKKRNLRQGVAQQLLGGKSRLPGFSQPWKPVRLGSIGECLRGVSYDPDRDLHLYDENDTVRLLRSNNVQNATVQLDDVQYVNRRRVSERQMMRGGDILICTANGSKALVGKAALFSGNPEHSYTFGAFMGCFRLVMGSASSSFVFFLTQTARYRQYISNLLAGSSINNLTPSAIESLEFPFPPMDEQNVITSILSDLEVEIAALEQRLAKTRALKQGMMQALMTGRVRLAQPAAV